MDTMTAKGPGNGRWGRRSQAGQSLVEFAAGLVVLIILVSGVLDIGRAFMSFVAMENGAGEGALFASVHPRWVDECTPLEKCGCDPEFATIESRTMGESPGGFVDWDNATVDVTAPTITVGYPITVTVTYSYPLLTPFISQLVGNGTLPLRASATEIIMSTDAPIYCAPNTDPGE